MTDEEIKRVAAMVAEQEKATQWRKAKHKGLFSRLIVLLCLGLAIGYTGICLLMQWHTGVQPEPQLTIVFLALSQSSCGIWPKSKEIRTKTKRSDKKCRL